MCYYEPMGVFNLMKISQILHNFNSRKEVAKMKENEKNNKLSKDDLESVAGGKVIYVRLQRGWNPRL